MSVHGLHTIARSTKSKTRKRVGRGNAAGGGTYAGRGLKGQRSRSGGKSGLAVRSMKSYLIRIPKTRGFKSGKINFETVNVDALQKHFNDSSTITPKMMRSKGLLRSKTLPIKILSRGTVSKKLHVTAHSFSENAREAITKAGGTAEVLMRQATSTAKKEVEKVMTKK